MELALSPRQRMAVTTLSDPRILAPALLDAVRKLDPRVMIRNPVMFTVEVVASLTTILFIRDLVTGAAGLGFAFQINLWLWFTVLFANFAEAVAEGRGKAQAATLRKAKTETMAGVTILGSSSAETGMRLRIFEVSMTLLRINSKRTACRRSSRNARRWVLARVQGRR